jgi:hypothetical protein
VWGGHKYGMSYFSLYKSLLCLLYLLSYVIFKFLYFAVCPLDLFGREGNNMFLVLLWHIHTILLQFNGLYFVFCAPWLSHSYSHVAHLRFICIIAY